MANPRRRKIWKGIALSLAVLGLLLIQTGPGEAGGRHHHHGRFHGHGRVFISVGPAFYWGYPYYPYWYGPPYYVYTPPPVIVEQAPAYAQTTPPPAAAPQVYWYYCPSAAAYYPTAPSCPEPWVKVPPRSE